MIGYPITTARMASAGPTIHTGRQSNFLVTNGAADFSLVVIRQLLAPPRAPEPGGPVGPGHVTRSPPAPPLGPSGPCAACEMAPLEDMSGAISQVTARPARWRRSCPRAPARRASRP